MTSRGRTRNGRFGHFGDTSVVDSVRIAVNLALKKFRLDEAENELEFPSSLSRTERAYVHKMAAEMAFKSKSRGKGQNRYITVYKNEGSTIVGEDAVLNLAQDTLKIIAGLLAQYPVSGRERADLLPVSERSGSAFGKESMPTLRSTGKLTAGVPRVAESWGGVEYQARRQELPIWQYRRNIITAIRTNQVVLITGDTGSGKTTQVPQFILEDSFEQGTPVRIVVCEPRRLAAVTVAARVAQERDEKLGQMVGYQIRLESCGSPQNLLTFCTYGVLLRSLMGGESVAQSFTHIIVDEVHERDKLSDFLLTVLRDMLDRYRGLRLILMSATVDTHQFLSYFPSCLQVKVPGRMYPVEEFYLEHILSLTNYLDTKSARSQQRSTASEQGLLLQQLAGQLSLESSSAGAASELADDVVVENSEGKELADEMMDRLLADCFRSGTPENFAELTLTIESDMGKLNYKHSVTGVTPLMVASSRGVIDLVELLLGLGANFHLTSGNGWTALDLARETGNSAVCEILEAEAARTDDFGTSNNSSQLTDEQAQLLTQYQSAFDDEQVDHQLIVSLLQQLVVEPPGDILVFLPGYEDIITIRDLIYQNKKLSGGSCIVFMLHSQMATGDHRKVFEPTPGRRKIILATNVAETGITLDGVVYVVDSGKVKEKTFDALTNTSMLKTDWISRSSATQRKGRAGRCQPGRVYRLFSAFRYAHLSAHPTPEILRTPLLELCLQTKLLAPPNTPIADFLARVPEPPAFLVTRNAVQALKTMEALDFWEEVTPLGSHLLELPLDPVLGKVLLHGVLLRCLDPVLSIVSCAAYRDPFQIPADPQAKRSSEAVKRRLTANTRSDHVILLRAYQEWEVARQEGRERQWCARNLVTASTMEMISAIRSQCLAQLRASGFINSRHTEREVNVNSGNLALVKACLVAGLYPNLARYDYEAGQFRTSKESRVRLHPSSVLAAFNKRGAGVNLPPGGWLLYHEMSRAGRTAYLRTISPVTSLTVGLLCGPARLAAATWETGERMGQVNHFIEQSSDSEEETYGDPDLAVINLDSWVALRSEPGVAQRMLQLRLKWTNLWLRRLSTPYKYNQIQDAMDDAVVAAMAAALAAEEEACGLPSTWEEKGGPPLTQTHLSSPQPRLPPGPPTKYFIVRPSSGSMSALEAAMSHHGSTGVWSFQPATERRLMAEVGQGHRVLVIFAVSGSQAVQGAAIFTGQTMREGARVGQKLEWMSRQGVSQSSLQLFQQLPSGGQDCQQLPDELAQQLLACLMEKGPGDRPRRKPRYAK